MEVSAQPVEQFPQLPQHRFVWIVLIAAILGLFGAALVNRLNTETNKLQVRFPLTDFSMTDQNGAEVSLKSLKGHAFVAGFIFTRCAGTCPMIVTSLSAVNQKLADEPRIQIVAFSMDPQFDTQSVLSDYAKLHTTASDSSRWHFVTTEHKEDMIKLTHDNFKLPIVEKNVTADEPIIHSSMLIVVDRQGRVRGTYSGLIATEVAQAAADARALEHELCVFSLPALNASLNGLCTIFLLAGYVLIRQRRILAHQTVMMIAGVTSALFLTSYLIYHYHAGSVKFLGQGGVRTIYFAILITHVVLAGVIGVLVPLTFWRAFQGNWERHRKIAKVTFPIWLYVSITGVVVYVMLYQLYPSA